MQQLHAPFDETPTPAMARSEQAMEAIRNWIIDGTLAPGAALVETQLASRLGVSRVPVREALQRLGQQGLVELRPGQSALVARRSARDVIELLEIRAVIQGFAASLVAERRTDEDIETLSGIVAAGRKAVEEEDWQQVGRLNSMFHLEMGRISGNNHIRDIVDNTRFQLAWLNQYMARKRGHQAWNAHGEVVEAVRERNAQKAEEVARTLILATKDSFVADYLAGRIST